MRRVAMRLTAVYARFFRSLNYDYLRKTADGYEPDPWDVTPSGEHYPFVRVRLEPDVTTVVGANEAGKSQLLGALKRGLTGDEIERGDFCRYSTFFQDDRLTHPEFGLEFRDLTLADLAVVREMCGSSVPSEASRLGLFRMNAPHQLRVYAQVDGEWQQFNCRKTSKARELGMPTYFEIDADIPLPDSVPLAYLASDTPSDSHGDGLLARVRDFIRSNPAAFESAATVTGAAEQIAAAASNGGPDDKTRRMHQLAADLLLKVAGVPQDQFEELQKASGDGRNGYAGSIVERINDSLARSLNFPQWWSQDTNFQLYVELRDEVLVFLIRDRTGTSYSFDERSEGLKYFLSYFVQYKSHEPPQDGRPQLLLMDEPDAYLSSSGQQDLLRIFEAFAHPQDPSVPAVQVIYVTHSPFLIDKNHSERIRVLQKGEHDEGTRVVTNAARNHYEPLRSAFGSYVGETTFIGTCNLLLEGASDQVLLAGMSSRLRAAGSSPDRTLDLNGLTLVPAGSASQVPYMAFLARGRDVDKPAVIVLLDGDKPGDDARKALRSGGPHRKRLVDDALVLQLSDPELNALDSDHPGGPVGIEDLVPLDVAVLAARRYCAEFVPQADLAGLQVDVTTVFVDERGTLAGVTHVIRDHLTDEEFHLDKIGFARSVLGALDDDRAGGGAIAAANLDRLTRNFELLFERLGSRQRKADRDERRDKISSRINRIRRRFRDDHPATVTRFDVTLLTEEIEGQLDDTAEAENIRVAMRRWDATFHLSADEPAPHLDRDAFMAEVDSLAYAGAREVQDGVAIPVTPGPVSGNRFR